jgi:hypothetical protein
MISGYPTVLRIGSKKRSISMFDAIQFSNKKDAFLVYSIESMRSDSDNNCLKKANVARAT